MRGVEESEPGNDAHSRDCGHCREIAETGDGGNRGKTEVGRQSSYIPSPECIRIVFESIPYNVSVLFIYIYGVGRHVYMRFPLQYIHLVMVHVCWFS